MKNSISEGDFWADKLMDLANYAIAGLVFSQFITHEISWYVIVSGILLYIGLALISKHFRGKR